MNKITITEIAEMAGVCIGTVSRVINNKDKVHPETRKKIQKLIEKTGYSPSAMGQGLRSRRSRCLLLQVPNIGDPYSASVAKAVSTQCRRLGYKMFLGDSDYDAETEAFYLRRLRDGGVDGLIISPLAGGKNEKLVAALVREGFPVVAMDTTFAGVKVNSVRYDDYAGASKAMDHLFERGHRRVAFIQLQTGFQTVRDRHRAYCESFERHGLKFHPPDDITAPPSAKLWDNAILADILRKPGHPTAILTENEIVASLCLGTLEHLQKRIPEDVAVVSFGDSLMEHFTPIRLTAVALHQDLASLQAIELLLELIDNPDLRKRPPREILLQPELIVRQST